MTNTTTQMFSSISAIANLLNRVVVLLLGTPHTVRLVHVVAAVDTAESRIMTQGGYTNGRA
jgi:hypothetical protein